MRTGGDDEIKIRPTAIVALVMLMGGGNLAFTSATRNVDAATVEQVAELQAQVSELKEKITTLQAIGPNGVMTKLDKIQGTVDSCMPCHLQNSPNHGNQNRGN